MLAVISAQSEDIHPELRLSNGETILHRQIRLLQGCGVYCFALVGAGPQTLTALQAEVDNRREIIALDNLAALSTLRDRTESGVLVLRGDVVFTASVPKKLLAGEAPCQTVISKSVRGITPPAKARVDMRYIVQIGTRLDGVGCFPHFPLYKLDWESFEKLAQAWVNEPSLFAAVDRLLPGLRLVHLDCREDDWISVAEEEVLAEVRAQLRLRDFAAQPIFRGSASILNLPALLGQYGVQKPLLVCDEHWPVWHVQEYLHHIGLQCTQVAVSARPGYDEVASAAALFRTEGCDGVLSVGGGAAIDAGKAIKAFSALNPSGDLLAQEMVYTSIPHIAIPAVVEAGQESTRFATLWRGETPCALAHDSLLPDVAILDDNLPAPVSGTAKSLRKIHKLLAAQLTNPAHAPESLLEVANFLGRAVNLAGEELTLTLGQALSAFSGLSLSASVALALPFGWAQARHPEKLLRRRVYRRLELQPDADLGALIGELIPLLLPEQPELARDQWVALLNEAVGKAAARKLIHKPQLGAGAVYYTASLSAQQAVTAKPTFIHRLLRLVRRLVRRIPPLNSAVGRAIHRLKFLYCRCRRTINYRTVVFESFAGQSYSCNPKALYEAMLADPAYSDFTFIWAFRHPEKFKFLRKNPNTQVVRRNSRKYYEAYARAKYLITNTGFPVFFRASREQVAVNTWHGKPLKRIGCDFSGASEGKRTKKEMVRSYTKSGKRLTYLFSPAPVFTDIMCSAYNLNVSKRRSIVVETGYPRNDFLFNYTRDDVLRVKLGLGIPLKKKVILYAPTWRPYEYQGGRKFAHHNTLDFHRLRAELGDEYVLLFRTHHLESASVDFSEFTGFIYDVTSVMDVNTLYIISDLMISDYSGTIFDYANLRRPMVFYMYDRERYMTEANGLYFPLEELPGIIVTREEELAAAVKAQLVGFTYDEKYQRFNETYNTLDGPDCAARCLARIIDLSAQPSRRQQLRSVLAVFKRNFASRVTGFFRSHGLYWSENSRRLAAYRNRFKGQRCFLIGNGPSLTMADLEKLKGEVSFGCNLIYKTFDSTDWRPTFLCLSEQVLARTISDELVQSDFALFVSSRAYSLMQRKPKNTIFVHSVKHDPYYIHGNMMDYYVPSFATVMTFMTELAMYMGFSEIYLLGVDATSGHTGAGHFTDDYLNDKMLRLEHRKARRAMRGKPLTLEEFGQWMVDRAMFAYTQLRSYADDHGYHIYNATRGGKLEAFERVDLDAVLGDKEEKHMKPATPAEIQPEKKETGYEHPTG